MSRKCLICGNKAIVAAKVNNGKEIINGFFCESCIRASARVGRLEVVASIHPSFPVGYVIGKVPETSNEEKDALDDFEFNSEEADFHKERDTISDENGNGIIKDTESPKLCHICEGKASQKVSVEKNGQTANLLLCDSCSEKLSYTNQFHIVSKTSIESSDKIDLTSANSQGSVVREKETSGSTTKTLDNKIHKTKGRIKIALLLSFVGVVILICFFTKSLFSNKDNSNYTSAIPTDTVVECEHEFISIPDVMPTCTENGHRGGTKCSKCGKIGQQSTIIKKTGHTTEYGKCLLCNKMIANGLEIPKTGIWTTGNYLDEFGEKTGEKFVTNKNYIRGLFSNTATTDSDLNVEILVDENTFCIMLYEYEKYLVKSVGSTKYNVHIKYGDKKLSFSDVPIYTDRITIGTTLSNFKSKVEEFEKLRDIFKKGYDLQFVIYESGRSTTQYSFTVPSSNFYYEYTELFGD